MNEEAIEGTINSAKVFIMNERQEKHAYLILAHGKMELLQILLNCLDDARNDIYIHIDKKTKTIPEFAVKESKLIVLTNNRVNVYWGDVSQIVAETVLVSAALESKVPYEYLHLISGVDLPIKSQNAIHAFFAAHKGKNFINYTIVDKNYEIRRKVCRWHLFPKQFRSLNIAIRAVRSLFLRFQELVGIERNRHIDFKKGAQWFSITLDAAKFFVSKREWFLKVFSHTFCCDEIALQTIIWNSEFRDTIYTTDVNKNGHMRLINWQNGKLIDWNKNDLDRLANSDALFARKFNASDMDFIRNVVKLSSE